MRNHCVVVGRTEVSRVKKSTKRGQLSEPILDNQLNEEASRKILTIQGRSGNQCLNLLFVELQGGGCQNR